MNLLPFLTKDFIQFKLNCCFLIFLDFKMIFFPFKIVWHLIDVGVSKGGYLTHVLLLSARQQFVN